MLFRSGGFGVAGTERLGLAIGPAVGGAGAAADHAGDARADVGADGVTLRRAGGVGLARRLGHPLALRRAAGRAVRVTGRGAGAGRDPAARRVRLADGLLMAGAGRPAAARAI